MKNCDHRVWLSSQTILYHCLWCKCLKKNNRIRTLQELKALSSAVLWQELHSKWTANVSVGASRHNCSSNWDQNSAESFISVMLSVALCSPTDYITDYITDYRYFLFCMFSFCCSGCLNYWTSSYVIYFHLFDLEKCIFNTSKYNILQKIWKI